MTRNCTSCSTAFAAFSGGATAHLVGADPLEGATWAAIGHMYNFLGHDGKEGYSYGKKKNLSKTELYSEIFIEQFSNQFGIKDILSLTVALDGQGLLDKPFTMKGSSKGTSVLSKYGSKALPQKMPRRLPTLSKNLTIKYTKVLGRFLGRSVPILGWATLAYDLGVIIYKTETIYNKTIIND